MVNHKYEIYTSLFSDITLVKAGGSLNTRDKNGLRHVTDNPHCRRYLWTILLKKLTQA